MSQPAGEKKPGLYQAAGILFAAMIGSNVCNYAFHAAASRTLGPGEYGSLVSMLALITVLAIPSQALQTVLAKQIALEEMTGNLSHIFSYTLHFFLRALVLGGLCGLAIIGISPYLKTFFRLHSTGPIIAVGVTMVIMLLIPVVRGTLQGLQQFTQLGLNNFSDGLVRLCGGWLLLTAGLGVTGGVAASALGAGVAFVVALVPLRWMRGQRLQAAEDLDLGASYRYLVPVLMAFGAYLILSSLDMLLVKHYLEPAQAGYYAAGSLIGKAFLFLPVAMTYALFPKVSVSRAQAQDPMPLLQKSLGATALGLILASVTVWLLAKFIILTLFGPGFLNAQTLQMVRWFGVAVTPLALVYILVQYHLALHEHRFMLLLLADIPVLLLLLIFFHQNLGQVLLVTGGNHLLLFLSGYGLSLRQGRAQ